MTERLPRGDLPPLVRVAPPGPRSRELSGELERWEAPAVNTLYRGRPAVVWREALGANVLDVDGNRYVDLTAGFGVAVVGHRHPAVVRAVEHQGRRLLHAMGDVAAHPTRIELARGLATTAPVRDAQVYFAVSGADAVEIALKTALLHTGRPGVVAFEPSYHGTTLGALAATSRPRFREPFRDQLHGHLRRLPFAAPPADLDRLLAGWPEAGALVVEPIVGREGVLVPPPGWLAQVAEVCRRHGVVWIADEIFTGCGRTGSMFRVEAEGLSPDLLCCGKGLGGGVPIGAVIGRADIMAAWDADGEALHTGTFVAHPLATSAALAVLEVLRSESLPARAVELGRHVAARVADWPDRFAALTAVRGAGLLWGLALRSAEAADHCARALLGAGVLALAGGADGNMLQLTPPLVITAAQLRDALDAVEACLAEAPASAG